MPASSSSRSAAMTHKNGLLRSAFIYHVCRGRLRRHLRLGLAVPALLLAVAACSPEYEIDRPGTWKPTGANDYNLQAMIANPLDLRSGISAPTDRGDGAARAVTRLLTDHRRPLLDATISRVAPAQNSGDTPMGGASSGPAGASSEGSQ